MGAGGINNPVVNDVFITSTMYTHVYVHTCNRILDTIYIHIKKQYT